MRVLGLDYGGKTIGVAVSDPLLITALGLEVIRRPGEAEIRNSIRRLKEIIREYSVGIIVLGYPKNLDGTESSRCKLTREFKDRLGRNFKNVEIHLWDERFTSVSAEKELASLGLNQKKIGALSDITAAVFILQGFLDNYRMGTKCE